MASDTKDDVDRLFECFKCGVSPPQSAVREKGRGKSKLKPGTFANEISRHSEFFSRGSAGQTQKNATGGRHSFEKLSSTSTSKGFNPGKHISPVIFYGSPHGVPPKRPSSLRRLLHEIRIDLAQQKYSELSEEIWATFPRQEEAMKYAKGHSHVHVFSYQDHFNGQRRYLVSRYKEFWRRYKSMDSKFRHHYEVIQEAIPCHLYFDLEYNKRVNTGKNGDGMVDSLISVLLEALYEKYSIQGNHDWIVELDSSTEEKFSRHLIIRIPNTAFKDNSHAGAFVAEICSRIRSGKEKDGRFKELFVKKDSSCTESSSQLFVDTAVYSRNRCFRLALSSKAGKTSVLLPTGRFACKDMCEEEMFMASLICNIDVNCEKLLACTMDLDCVKTLYFGTEDNHSFGKYSKPTEEISLSGCMNDLSTTYFMGKSAFPALDRFVESVATIGNVSGKIRSWYWFSEYGLMVYSMSRNRYCERIGRQHKSNHVMYIVDLRRAVYYQKCHDPDCRGYRSPLRPIPEDIIPSPWGFTDSVEVPPDKGLNNDGINYQSIGNNQKCVLLFNDGSIKDGSVKDSWWLEAVQVADLIENKHSMEKFDFADDDWWMNVETCINGCH